MTDGRDVPDPVGSRHRDLDGMLSAAAALRRHGADAAAARAEAAAVVLWRIRSDGRVGDGVPGEVPQQRSAHRRAPGDDPRAS